jgi:hypothetical protein
MNFKRLGIAALVLPLLDTAAIRQPVDASTVQHVDFAAGGTVRLLDSFGYLTVEAWDKPEVEVTLTKTRDGRFGPEQEARLREDMERVQVAVNRKSATEMEVTTILPKRKGVLGAVSPWRKTKGGVSLEYHLFVPRDSNLVVQHHGGSVLVNGVSGNVSIASSSGDIVLMIPDPESYEIDAKSRIGTVSLDFADASRRRYFAGESFLNEGQGKRKIFARVGYGGVTVKALP